jgi:hypothetical protein
MAVTVRVRVMVTVTVRVMVTVTLKDKQMQHNYPLAFISFRGQDNRIKVTPPHTTNPIAQSNVFNAAREMKPLIPHLRTLSIKMGHM